LRKAGGDEEQSQATDAHVQVERDCLKAPVSWRDQLVEVQPR
jgi:hypothetical protein